MRLIVARCEVRYSGRLSAVLPEALRLIMVKSDGSVMVHADHGGFKPSNWILTNLRRIVKQRFGGAAPLHC
jgi:endonuclease